MKRIYLIDCPGVVPPNQGDSPEDILLRGVVRVENVENPEQYIPAVLKRVKPQHIERTYDVRNFASASEFLEMLARKGGRLLKGGEVDADGVAKMVLHDFLRGKIPWFTPPPEAPQEVGKGVQGRKGVLGEMGKIDTRISDSDQPRNEDMEINNSDDHAAFEGFEKTEDESDDASTDDEGGAPLNEASPLRLHKGA